MLKASFISNKPIKFPKCA